MKTLSKRPHPDTLGPFRPYPAAGFQALGPLADLLQFSDTDGGALPVDFGMTCRLSEGRWADTWSHGTLRLLRTGELVAVCTTFDRRGRLLLEGPRGRLFPLGAIADMARAVRDGHGREQRLVWQRRTGRN